MQVKSIMNTKVKTANPDTSIRELAKIMVMERISTIPVIDQDNNLVGIISEKDILQNALPALNILMSGSKPENRSIEDKYTKTLNLQVKDLMCVNVAKVESSMPCMIAASMMWVRNFRRIPVVTNGKLVGIISTSSIHRAIFTMSMNQG